MARFIQIDEEGYFASSGLRISDEVYGLSLISHIQEKNRGFVTLSGGVEAFVEAFDVPLVARHVTRQNSELDNDEGEPFEKTSSSSFTFSPFTMFLQFNYGFISRFDVRSLVTDEWDRFHGRTADGLPFVFSRPAQMEFFNLLENFDDDAIWINGEKVVVPSINDVDRARPLYKGEAPPAGAHVDVNTLSFWTERYEKWTETGEKPGWELGEAAKPMREALSQVKMPRSRICVLGSGTGYDAAYFASQGHIVTAVDLSPLAVKRARELHGESANLKFVEADSFAFAKSSNGSQQFDVVFEHCFFCAIDPARRQELVRAWRSLLVEGGHILGVFFILDRVGGPPYGVSEWALKKHLQNDFEFLYWTRWKTSINARLGKELVIYTRKK